MTQLSVKATDLVDDWMALFETIGVPSYCLERKGHSDCPICGTVKGFRTNITGKKDGTWVCKHCTSSSYKSGFDFVYMFLKCSSYSQAASEIYKVMENRGRVSRPAKPKVLNETKIDFEAEVKKRTWLFQNCRKVVEGDPVWRYLRRRVPGLESIPNAVRFMPEAQYWEEGKLVSKHPAMVVAGYDSEGRVVQLHTTYLTPDGQKAPVRDPKKTKSSIGVNSFAFRLLEVGDDGVLGLSEGIETSLAAAVKFNHAVWACHSNTVLANFKVPSSLISCLKKIIIYADNDGWRQKPDGTRWNPGVTKARELAVRLRNEFKSQGIRIPVLIAYRASIGDFAD